MNPYLLFTSYYDHHVGSVGRALVSHGIRSQVVIDTSLYTTGSDVRQLPYVWQQLCISRVYSNFTVDSKTHYTTKSAKAREIWRPRVSALNICHLHVLCFLCIFRNERSTYVFQCFWLIKITWFLIQKDFPAKFLVLNQTSYFTVIGNPLVHSLHLNPCNVLLSHVFVLSALIAS